MKIIVYALMFVASGLVYSLELGCLVLKFTLMNIVLVEPEIPRTR